MTLETDIKQTKPFRTLEEKTIVNVMYTNNWLCNKQHHIIKHFGITLQQYNVLRILKGRREEPITINGIMERMLDKMSNASRLVDKLVQKNLASRSYREDDRRACNVLISEEGEKVLEQINIGMDNLRGTLGNLSEEDLNTLNNLLDKFRNEH